MLLPIALKQFRAELQLQQKELAELLHVNATTINRWETGRSHPSKVVRISLLNIAKKKGTSEVCYASLKDALYPKAEMEEKANDLRYTEIDSINQLANEAPNGVVVIGFDNYEILYMNDKMIEMTGVSMAEAVTMQYYQLLAQDKKVCDNCDKSEKSHDKLSTKDDSSARYRNFCGRYYVINTKMITWKGQKALLKYFTDVTELHELQQQVQKQQEALNCAAQFAGMQVIQYDIQKNTATLMTDTLDVQGLPKKVENFDTASIDAGIIPLEYAEQYSQMIQDIRDGKAQAEAEVRTKEPDGTSNWLHYQMNLISIDETGKPLTAIMSARVINREKSMQERIRFEHERVINEQKNLVAYEISNLTENKILEHRFLREPITLPIAAYESYDGSIQWCPRWIIGSSNQKRYTDIHQREFLIKSFSNGVTSFTDDYRMKRSDGFEVWIRNTLHLHQDIITGDIDLYEYYLNIDERKLFENFLRDNRRRAHRNFSVLYLESGQLNEYIFSETEKQSAVTISDYTTAMRQCCERYVIPEERDYFMECMDIESLKKKLGEKNRFQFSYQFMSDEGGVCKKLVRITWLDYENKICMISSMAAENGGTK